MSTLRHHLLGLALVTAVPVAACSDATTSGPPAGRLQIAVQALSLSPITGASYDITVRNSDPAPNNVVWAKSHITSADYGDGRGAISYVGPCDATRNPHTVELVLNEISDTQEAPIPTGRWANPAPPGAPLIVEANCQENADTPVTFNLTIMRAAQQGFFDIAVNFEDIFCSAKVDCREGLLHDGAERGPTVVFGFACTAGRATDGAQPTWLHMSDIALECDGMPPLYVNPAGATGQHGPLGTLPTAFETAIYRGQEELPGLDKCFWNAALGIRVGNAPSCHLRARATASHAPFGASGMTPADTVYPFVDFDVVVSDAGGHLVCTNNGLDDLDSGVTTHYTAPTGAGFGHEWECDSGTEPNDKILACSGAFEGGAKVGVLPTPDGLRVSFGGVRSDAYTLPEGAFVAGDASCCVNPCCDATN